MKIVISSDDNLGLDGQVSAHFGRCSHYTIVDVEDGKITGASSVENPTLNNHQPGMAPRFIAELGADVILAGGMGPRAIQMFLAYEISSATGAYGPVRGAVEAYLAGQLRGVEACAHSDHEHGDHEHGDHELGDHELGEHEHGDHQASQPPVQVAALAPGAARDTKVASPVVIPATEDGDLSVQADSRFGRAHFFALVDLDNAKLLKMVANEGANAGHGAGTGAAQVVAKLGGKSAVSGHFGPKAAQALQALEVQMWELPEEGLSLAQIVEQLRAGALHAAEV